MLSNTEHVQQVRLCHVRSLAESSNACERSHQGGTCENPDPSSELEYARTDPFFVEPVIFEGLRIPPSVPWSLRALTLCFISQSRHQSHCCQVFGIFRCDLGNTTSILNARRSVQEVKGQSKSTSGLDDGGSRSTANAPANRTRTRVDGEESATLLESTSTLYTNQDKSVPSKCNLISCH